MPVRHVLHTEHVAVDVDMPDANADEELEYDNPSDLDYIPPDGYDSLDDEPLPLRRSARKTRKSTQDRANIAPDRSPFTDTSGNPNEPEFDIEERPCLPPLPETLPQKVKDVLNLVVEQQGPLAGGELLQIAINYIENSMDSIVLQLIANVLALAPEDIMSQVANTVAQIIYNCWINSTGSFMLGEVLSTQQTYDGNQIISFLEHLGDRDVEALFTRTDW